MIFADHLRRQARVCARLAEDCEDQHIAELLRVMAINLARLVESISGYPHLKVRWNLARRREVRDFVSTSQRATAEEVKERMNKLYASEVNVRYFDAARSYRKRRRALRSFRAARLTS